MTVYLPRTESELANPSGGDTGAGIAITHGARVLLVDDDADVRATTVLVLETIGYAVTPADGGAEALRLIDVGEAFDLLITDVVMPDMSGGELANEMRSRRPAMPIIFISGYADPAARTGRHALQPLIRKPFRATDLAQSIEQSLSDARKIASLRPQA